MGYRITRGCGGNRQAGFTVVEFFVIILVMMVFATMAIPHVARIVEQQRVAAVVKHFDAIKKAQAMHYSLNGSYTTSLASLAVEVPEVDDGIAGSSDGQWEYAMAITRGVNSSFSVTATRMSGRGMPGSVVWDSSVGGWSGTHPLRPR